MLSKVKAFCENKELLTQGDRVLLGLSGGADSVCLFFVLLELAKEWQLSLVPVHVHHHIRGEEADADLQFCRSLCARFGLSLISVHAQVRELAREQGWSEEEAGRNARYEAFERISKEMCCNKIAVAHHQNDQAETVLFQLFRGSRLRGLSGMEAKNAKLIRPLLLVTKEEIEAFLNERGEAWCTDSTNLSEEYTRNRIRRLLLLAEDIVPGAGRHVAEAAQYLQRVEQLLASRADALYEKAVTGQTITEQTVAGQTITEQTVEGQTATRQTVAGQPVTEQTVVLDRDKIRKADSLTAEQVIYRALCELAGKKKDISSVHVAACMQLLECQTGRKIELPHHITVKRSYDRLLLTRKVPVPDNTEKPLEEVPEKPLGEIPEKPLEKVPEEFLEKPLEKALEKDTVLSGPGVELTLSVRELTAQVLVQIKKSGGIPKCTYTKWFDYDKISDILTFRTPQPSDYIAVYADGRGKKLGTLFKDEKIPQEERSRIWVLAEGNRVLWVPGIRGSEAYRVTKDTRRILVVTMRGRQEDGGYEDEGRDEGRNEG